MYIEQAYKYKYDGIVYVGFKIPDGAEILETLDILTAEDGCDLIRISDNENMGNSVWLHNGDTQENYKEVEIENPEESKEEGNAE